MLNDLEKAEYLLESADNADVSAEWSSAYSLQASARIQLWYAKQHQQHLLDTVLRLDPT